MCLPSIWAIFEMLPCRIHKFCCQTIVEEEELLLSAQTEEKIGSLDISMNKVSRVDILQNINLKLS